MDGTYRIGGVAPTRHARAPVDLPQQPRIGHQVRVAGRVSGHDRVAVRHTASCMEVTRWVRTVARLSRLP